MTIQIILIMICVCFRLIQNQNFGISQMQLSFNQANDFCKDMYGNGRLAVIKSSQSKETIRRLLYIDGITNSKLFLNQCYNYQNNYCK